jgi:hypothetical protein
MAERDLSPRQLELADLMSEISEDCYCAGWLIGTEFVLWGAVLNGPIEWGCGDVTEEQVAALRRLSGEIGGWIAWEVSDDPMNTGPVFVPIVEWRERYAAEPSGGRP